MNTRVEGYRQIHLPDLTRSIRWSYNVQAFQATVVPSNIQELEELATPTLYARPN